MQSTQLNPARTKICKNCEKEKLVLIDFPLRVSTNVCKNCHWKKKQAKLHADGMNPQDHWKYRPLRFALGKKNKEDFYG